MISLRFEDDQAKHRADTLRALPFPVWVLLAVRHPVLRSVLRDILRAHGLTHIDVVLDTDNLVTALRRGEHDLFVVCDDLENGTGESAIRRLRDGGIGPHPFPLVMMVMNASAGLDQVAKVIQSGPDDICLAPFSVDTARLRLDRLMDRRRPFIVSPDYVGPVRPLPLLGFNFPISGRLIEAPHPIVLKLQAITPQDFRKRMTAATHSIRDILNRTHMEQIKALLGNALSLCSSPHPRPHDVAAISTDIITKATHVIRLAGDRVDPLLPCMVADFTTQVAELTRLKGKGGWLLAPMFHHALAQMSQLLER